MKNAGIVFGIKLGDELCQELRDAIKENERRHDINTSGIYFFYCGDEDTKIFGVPIYLADSTECFDISLTEINEALQEGLTKRSLEILHQWINDYLYPLSPYPVMPQLYFVNTST